MQSSFQAIFGNTAGSVRFLATELLDNLKRTHSFRSGILYQGLNASAFTKGQCVQVFTQLKVLFKLPFEGLGLECDEKEVDAVREKYIFPIIQSLLARYRNERDTSVSF